MRRRGNFQMLSARGSRFVLRSAEVSVPISRLVISIIVIGLIIIRSGG